MSNSRDFFGILGSSHTNPKTYSSQYKNRVMKGAESPTNGFKKYDLDISPESESKFINPLNKRDLSQTPSPTRSAQFKPIRDFSYILEPEDDELAFHMPSFDESLDNDELLEFRPFQDRILLQPLENIEKSPLSPEVTRQATCPMCGAAVNAEFLKTYNSGKQMNTRTQAKFCGAHKKRSAQDEWVSRGYPTIDWDGLDARMVKHHSYLKDLLDGASSYSRDMLDEHVKSGKNRTLKQAVMDSNLLLTPGYYGPRGMMAMSENIIYKFSSQLRSIAVKDRLVSARGVPGYVQAVLVPELAVRLIAEDMGVKLEEARQVMRESAGLGDLLNEEVEDVVIWKEGGDL